MVTYLSFENKAQWDAFGMVNSFDFQILNQLHNTQLVDNPDYEEGSEEPSKMNHKKVVQLDEYLVNVLCEELPEALKPFELSFEPKYPKGGRLWV